MSASGDTVGRSPQRGWRDGWWDRRLRERVWRRFESLRDGRVILEQAGACREFGRSDSDLPPVRVRIRDARCYRQLAFGGSLGAAEAYLRGYWDCDDLVGLIRVFCRNAELFNGLDRGVARLFRPLARLAHGLRRNTMAGSRRNIGAHYDLGNEFFARFLDPTMAYSCAIFPQATSSLHEASLAKFARICQKLGLQSHDHLLEIGTGWGGLAIYAARHHGCRVTSTTISPRQFAYAVEQVAAAGLQHLVTVCSDDYRNLQGTYDKLVSIEMIEAVGHQYFETFFQVCSQRLKPDGLMLLQAIVIPDQRYSQYCRSVDFIQRYVFPGGCLPSLGAICGSLGRRTDLQPVHLEDLTAHYARTLATWRQRFVSQRDTLRAMGFSERFLRTWEFYFCYCEGGFRERAIGDVQLLLAKPDGHRLPPFPPLSAAPP